MRSSASADPTALAEEGPMWLLLGVAMLGIAMWILKLAKPNAEGRRPFLMNRPGADALIAIALTTLMAFGIVFTVYGLAQIGG
jgi:TRAP-type C4-dicarboxylate transport system permease small subunit